MQNINAFDHAETILKVLAKGAFLTTAAGGRHNTICLLYTSPSPRDA